MSKLLPRFGVPVSSFALAVFLSWIAGPSRLALSLRMAADPTASCSVSISGPDKLCGDDRADYTAKGAPTGGTYEWTLTGEGAAIEFAKGDTASVKANNTGKSFTLHVAYILDSNNRCTANKVVTVQETIYVPICARRLKSSDGTVGTAKTAAQVQEAIDKANEIWHHCCIRFYLVENHEANTKKNDDKLANSIPVTVTPDGASSKGFEKVRKIDHHASCINVYFVKDLTNVQGLTHSPTYGGTGDPGGLNDAATAVDDSADGSTLAHELGHELGLHHLEGKPKKLMNDSGADGKDIGEDECEKARANAKRLLAAFNK